MTNEQLLDLLRAMRGAFAVIKEMGAEYECDCPPEWARCEMCRIRQYAGRAQRLIEDALAERQDSATPVVESDDLWWQDKTFRAAVGSITVLVQSNGRHEWCWSATSSERQGKYGLLDSCQGRATTLDEAKSAAIAAAKEKK